MSYSLAISSMKTIETHDTTVIGALFCLGYRHEKLQKSKEVANRVEFVFKHSKKLESDIEDIKLGTLKFSAHDIALELHSVRSRIKNFIKI